jgi:hypothetical protein
MSLRSRVLALAVPAMFLVACQEQPSAPQQQTHPAIAAEFMNNPGHVGPWINRYEEGWLAAAWYSSDLRYEAIHTTFPLDWVGVPWDEAQCGPPFFGGFTHRQEISHWDPTHTDPLARYIVQTVTDSIWIVLLDLSTSGPCADPYSGIGGGIVASGWGRLHTTDNNATLSGTQETYTLRADGDLTTPGGDPVKYSGNLRINYNPGSKPTLDYNNHVNFH